MESFILKSSKCFGKTLINETNLEYRRKRKLYDKFLEQHLTLDMFIGDKALFEKIHESDNFWCESMIENETIEDLLKDDINFTLTPYAIKQLGL